jgi:predicted amidohydrolase YtcJ
LILANARVYTIDCSNPTAEALRIVGDRIDAVGSDSGIRELAQAGEEILDLEGAALVPGFIDSHTHLVNFALDASRLLLEDAKSVEEIQGIVGKAAAKARPGEWIEGRGFNKNLFPDESKIAKNALDSVAPDNPVFLWSKDDHVGWCNSEALRLAGITASAPDTEGGRIVRDRNGEATGIVEENAVRPFKDAIGRPSLERAVEITKGAIRTAHAFGITGIHNCEEPFEFEVFQRILGPDPERDTPPQERLRVFHMIDEDFLDQAVAVGLKTGFGNDYLRAGCLKILSDGALGSQTASMLEPYDGIGGTGIALYSREDLFRMVRRANAAGIACAIHAIGDKANRVALDAFEAASEELSVVSYQLSGGSAEHGARSTDSVLGGRRSAVGGRALRNRIEHAQLVHPDDIPRFAELGVIASMQPCHMLADIDTADRYWGKRCSGAFAIRSLVLSAAKVCFGTDVPIEGLDPMRGIFAAVFRRKIGESDAKPWQPQETISVEEALRHYTLDAAYGSGEESIKGSIERGKLADLTVLSNDIVARPESILETVILRTYIGGELVYSR